MTVNPAAAARVIPLTALLLAACVSEKTYEQQTQQLQQAPAQAAEQSQVNKMQGANA
jgi:outer membrane biogenesis lipoprotein LolB